MEITIMTLGALGLIAAVIGAVALATRWSATHRFTGRSPSSPRLDGWRLHDWTASDPLLFVGGQNGTAGRDPDADAAAVGCH